MVYLWLQIQHGFLTYRVGADVVLRATVLLLCCLLPFAFGTTTRGADLANVTLVFAVGAI